MSNQGHVMLHIYTPNKYPNSVWISYILTSEITLRNI